MLQLSGFVGGTLADGGGTRESALLQWVTGGKPEPVLQAEELRDVLWASGLDVSSESGGSAVEQEPSDPSGLSSSCCTKPDCC